MEEQIQPKELAPRPRRRRRSETAEPAVERTTEAVITQEPEPNTAPAPAQHTQLIRPMPRLSPVPRRGVKSAVNISR